MAQASGTACVFISYSSRDEEIAETLCLAIESRGIPCWFAKRDIGPGDGYQTSIVQAIQRSKAMLLIFSQNANRSNEILKEMALASQNTIPLIPVRIEDVLPTGPFQYVMATHQYVDMFRNWEAALERITSRLNELLGRKGDTIPEREIGHPPGEDPREIVGEPPEPVVPPRAFRLRHGIAAGLIAAALLAVAGSYFVFRPFEPTDMRASYPETAATRLNGFSFETSPNEIKPGSRRWKRVTSDRWIEEYPDGAEETLRITDRIHVGGCDGSTVQKWGDEALQIFLPDRNCQNMSVMFRRLPARTWLSYVHMDDAR